MRITTLPLVLPTNVRTEIEGNDTGFAVSLFVELVAQPGVIQRASGWEKIVILPSSSGSYFCFEDGVSRPEIKIAWFDRIDIQQLPSPLGCAWTTQIEVKVILTDGESHVVATLDAPFTNQSIEGYFLPSTGINRRVKYLFLKSVDRNPIPAGLKIKVKAFSLTQGELADGYMVDLSDVSGTDRVYSAPSEMDWWSIGETPVTLEMTYQAPLGAPPYCETPAEIERVGGEYATLCEVVESQSPAVPLIPSLPEVQPPPEYPGGTPIPEPTPDPNCVCSVSYHYIAKAIDTRGAEIAGEIRGYRREFVQLMQAINEFLQTMTKQNDRTRLTVSDEIRDTLEKIVKALYLNADNPAYDPSRMTLSDLLASLLNHMEIR